MSAVYRFVFNKRIKRKAIEEQVALAIKAAEGVYGRGRVRLNAGYAATDGRAIIDASNRVSERIAEIFTDLITEKFGENSFKVDRVPKRNSP
jgi:hypothetical protein